MSSPSEPSAGAARPDAAPTEMALSAEGVENARRFALEGWGATCTQTLSLCATIDALRVALAEREAECERLRPFETRYKWLKRWLRSEINPRRLPEGWVVGPSSEFDKIVNLASGASAAVAPAAREPTTETSDGE